jgi:hypothetical protein
MRHIFAILAEGVALGWLGLALLVWISRRDAEAEPASRHRALCRVLVFAALLIGIPGVRASLGSSMAGLGPLPDAFIATPLAELSSAQGWALSQPWLGRVLLPGIGAAWLLLVATRLAAIAVRARHLHGLLSRARAPVPGLIEALAREARAVSIDAPELLVSDEVGVPFTVRVFRPAIVLPSQLAGSADPETLRLILRHELSHVARGDVARDVAVTLLLALFSIHPLARSLAREIRLAREAAVDAHVAPSAPRAYANLLVMMAERVRHAGELGVGMDDTELGARIRRILDGAQVKRRAARMAPLAIGFALLACSGAAVPALDSKENEAPADSKADEATVQPAGAARFSVRMVARDAPIKSAADGSLASLPLAELILRAENVRGVHVTPAQDPQMPPAITIELTPEGQRAAEQGTAGNVGRHMAILVGDRVVAAPVLRAPLHGAQIQITTNTQADFAALAQALGAR